MLIAPDKLLLDIYYIPGLNKDVIGFQLQYPTYLCRILGNHTDANSDNIDDNENQELCFDSKGHNHVTTQVNFVGFWTL